MHLDPQLIIALGLGQPLLAALVLMLAMHGQQPLHAERSLRLWSAALLLSALGWGMIGLDAWANPQLCLIIGYGSFMGACATVVFALRALFSCPLQPWRVAAPALLAWLAIAAFTIVWPDQRLREVTACVASAGLLLTSLWPLRGAWRRGGETGQRVMLALMLAIVGNQLWLALAPMAPLQQASQLISALSPMLASLGFLLLYGQINQRTLARLTRIDRLTQVHNREALYQESDRLFASALRHGRSLSLLRIDIDHFQRVNEIVGTRGGERLLRAVAALLSRTLRKEDLIARLDGTEFVVLLPDTVARGARESGERLREAVAAMRERIGGRLVAATVSIGVTDMRPGDRGVDTLLQRTATALRAARRAGCNRVAVYLTDVVDGSLDDMRAADSPP